MKIKEIDRIANTAWSPKEIDPIYLAVGTAAQQLDSSFSTNAALEIYEFDVKQGGLDLPVKVTLSVENRFHKLIWGSFGIGGDNADHPSGVIVGGCDNGIMQVYDASKFLKNENPLVLTKNKQTGPVRALDFNPFRTNLLASGASDSEILIWDLNSPKVTPMAPGSKIQPADDVSHLSWNKQVEHILASTFSTRCVVWDLRKSEPVIKVSDTTSKIRYKVVEWHPEVATQMCLASEDDSSPVIQLWDLRYATAPLKVIQGHQRGILGMAWCPQDPDLLITCGKDARIICWNPNYPYPGYEMVCDIPTSSQFSFDVSFCPKNPIVIASSSYDGRVSIFGLSGGAQHPVISSKLADSFPGMDLTMTNTPIPSQQPSLLQLRDAPKWLKSSCGASFAFGGKLITFTNVKSAPVHQGQTHSMTGQVIISQLVTLPNLIERAKKLEVTLNSGSLEAYCAEKAIASGDSSESRIWEFLQASFSENPRNLYLSMLGFDTAEMMARLDKYSGANDVVDGLSNDFEGMGRGAPDGYANGYDNNIPTSLPKGVEPDMELEVPFDDSSIDGKINQALLSGRIDFAVNLCLENERWADAILLASKGSPELLIKAQNKYFQKCHNEATQTIRAVVTHDLSRIIEKCKLSSWKQALAMIITYGDREEFTSLTDQLGQRLQGSKDESQKIGALLCCICSGNLNHLVDVWIGDQGRSKADTAEELQDLVEQVMILRKAGELSGRESNIDGGALAAKLVQYSSLLASQGCLETALNFLGDSSNDPSISSLRERLYYSLRHAQYTPTRSEVSPRSRQTSESRGGSMGKRPSYPTPAHPALMRRESSDVLNSTDFSNLTGPVHPPSAPTQPSYYGGGSNAPNPYGNIYVNSNTGPTMSNSNTGSTMSNSQFSPSMSSSGSPNYGGNAGLLQRPPSTTPGSMYNPLDVPVNTVKPLGSEPPRTRTPLGSSLPHPVSSVTHGWNDPPQIKSSSKSKPTGTANPVVQPITHPIFGSGPEPVNQAPVGPPSRMDGYGMNSSYQTQSNMGQQNPVFHAPPPSSANPLVQQPFYGNAPEQFNQTPAGPPRQMTMNNSYSNPNQPNNQNPANIFQPIAPPSQMMNNSYSNSANPLVQQPFYGNAPEQINQAPPGPPRMGSYGMSSLNPNQVPNPSNAFQPFAPPQPSTASSLGQPFIAPPPPNTANPIVQPNFRSAPEPFNQTSVGPPPPSHMAMNNPVPNHTFQPIAPPPGSGTAPISAAKPPPPAPVKEPEPTKQLGPIPSEHVTLMETLECLRVECYEVAHLQQMKRKLEDVARKLDIFSERLRAGSLSEATLKTFHNLVDAVKAHDYQSALTIHTQLVTGGNFAEISSFLPAIKVLIQSANQLGV